MKTNYRLMVKVISILLVVLLMGVFTQCVATNTTQVGGSEKNNQTSPTHNSRNKDEGQIINQAQVSEGIKNHEQIFYTMSALTGVPVTNNNVRNLYKQVSTTLPTDNDIKVFMAPQQLAITKLAAEFCNELVNSTSLRANVWNSYNGFNQSPNQGALDLSNRDLIIEEALDAFWGDVVTEEERQTAINELHQLIDELLINENFTSSGTTRNVVKGVCTSVLASAHVTLL